MSDDDEVAIDAGSETFAEVQRMARNEAERAPGAEDGRPPEQPVSDLLKPPSTQPVAPPRIVQAPSPFDRPVNPLEPPVLRDLTPPSSPPMAPPRTSPGESDPPRPREAPERPVPVVELGVAPIERWEPPPRLVLRGDRPTRATRLWLTRSIVAAALAVALIVGILVFGGVVGAVGAPAWPSHPGG